MAERQAVAVTIAAVAAAYLTAFAATFQFDDFHAVVDNADVRSWAAWAASMPGIRALTKASYVASYVVAPAPWSFVAVSVALHAANALLVLLLARRWLAAMAPGSAGGIAPLVAALVFALHPAQTEAVTYVAGRSVVLSSCAYLASLLAFERWRDGGKPAMLAVSLASFALALAARETTWTLPFALLLACAARGRPMRDALRSVLPYAAVLAFALVAAATSPTYRRLLEASLATRGPVDNLFAQVEGVRYLVTHPLLTLRVNFDPDVPIPAAADAGWWIAVTAIGGAIALGFATLRRTPWVGFGVLWFFLHLVPTSGLVARYDLVNDRHLYLAMVGPALIAGVLVARIPAMRVRSAAAVALGLLLAAATLVRNTDYASEVALWRATVRASPDKSRAWNNLGWACQQAGDAACARAAYTRALALDPANFRARANLDAMSAR